MDFAEAEFAPDCVKHVPGVANPEADSLSRQWQPGFEYTLPSILSGAADHSSKAPARGRELYITQAAP